MGCVSQKISSNIRESNVGGSRNESHSFKQNQNTITKKNTNLELIRRKINYGKLIKFPLNDVILEKYILNSTIMIRRLQNQENQILKQTASEEPSGCI